MKKEKIVFKTINEYTASFPNDVRKRLKEIKSIVKAAAPDAKEVISYNMPAYKLNGMLLYFAAHKEHIGFYPMRSGINEFKEEIAGYKYAAGSVQFPFNKPLPVRLIKRMVKFRAEENRKKMKSIKKK